MKNNLQHPPSAPVIGKGREEIFSPRLEQALMAVDLAFETAVPQPQECCLGAIIEAKLVARLARRRLHPRQYPRAVAPALPSCAPLLHRS